MVVYAAKKQSMSRGVYYRVEEGEGVDPKGRMGTMGVEMGVCGVGETRWGGGVGIGRWPEVQVSGPAKWEVCTGK